MTPSTEAIEMLAAQLAKADQLDWNETCGYQTDRDECDSDTCVAAHFEDHDAEWARSFYRRFARTALTYVRPFEGMEAALTYLPAGWAWSVGQMMGLPEKYRYRCFISDHNTPDGIAKYHLHGEAPTAVEAIRAAIDILHGCRPEVPRVEAAPLPAASAGNVILEEAARAFFERGFMACYAWQLANVGAQLCDAVLDHAWDHREEGGDLPSIASGPAGEVFTGVEAWDELVNVDDRTSPAEYPDMCLITRDELIDFMRRGSGKIAAAMAGAKHDPA